MPKCLYNKGEIALRQKISTRKRSVPQAAMIEYETKSRLPSSEQKGDESFATLWVILELFKVPSVMLYRSTTNGAQR